MASRRTVRTRPGMTLKVFGHWQIPHYSPLAVGQGYMTRHGYVRTIPES